MLDETHLPAIVTLRHDVLTHLSHPDLYVAEDSAEDFIRMHFVGASRALGIFSDDTLIAYGLLLMPATVDAEQLGMRQSMARRQAALPQLSSCMVATDHRGHGLQRWLIAARLRAGIAMNASDFWAMVSPHNRLSRANLEAEGFTLTGSTNMDGRHRQIMTWSLRDHFATLPSSPMSPI